MITDKTGIERHNVDPEAHQDIRELVSQETQDRESSISEEVTAREGADSSEAQSREDADNAEMTARESAISNEATSRQDADQAEALVRAAADETLDTEKANKITLPAQAVQDLLSMPRLTGFFGSSASVIQVNTAVGITFNVSDWAEFAYIDDTGTITLYTIKWSRNLTPTSGTQYQLIYYINGVANTTLANYDGSTVTPVNGLSNISLLTNLGWKTNGTVGSNWDGFLMSGTGDSVTVDMNDLRKLLVSLQRSDADIFDDLYNLIRTQSQMFIDINGPTGFIDNADITVTYDSGSRKITLTNPNGLYYYFGGKKYSLGNSYTSGAHDTAYGQYFLYSTDGITFSWSTSLWPFTAVTMAMVNYQSAYQVGVREVHGTIPYDTHDDLHNRIGTWSRVGADMSGYVLYSTTAADRQPAVSASVIRDEDVDTQVAVLAKSGPYTCIYLTGAGSISSASGTDVCVLTGGVPSYNAYDGSNWSTAPIPDGNYVSVWLMAIPTTADTGSQAFRYVWVMGESYSSNIAGEESKSPADLKLGGVYNLGSEFVFVNHVIICYTASNWQIVEVIKLTGAKVAQLAMTGSSRAVAVSTDGVTIKGNGLPSFPIAMISQNAYMPTNTSTSSYTLTLTDAFTRLLMNSSSAATVTIPLNSSAAFPVGTEIEIVNINTGTVTISPADGVTIQSYQTKVSLAGQYAEAKLIKTATDTWLLVGTLA
jgi:hypothetical protein